MWSGAAVTPLLEMRRKKEMYRKWLGWKKVAVCLVGAAMVMQGASMTMAADEYPNILQSRMNLIMRMKIRLLKTQQKAVQILMKIPKIRVLLMKTQMKILPMKTLFMRKQTRILLMRIPTVSQM